MWASAGPFVLPFMGVTPGVWDLDLSFQDLICLGTKEVAHKVLLTLKSFLKRNEDIHLCDLLRSQFLQILQKLLVENSSSISQGYLPLGIEEILI